MLRGRTKRFTRARRALFSLSHLAFFGGLAARTSRAVYFGGRAEAALLASCMDLRRLVLALGLLCACDSLAAPVDDGDQTELEPLPPELVAACPESELFKRTGSNACTAIGCQNGYNLDVSPSSGWAPGAYLFELIVDGRVVNCGGSIPLKACGEPSFSCSADGVRLGESGCALEPTQQGIASILFDGFPLALFVRVRRDGEQLVKAELSPVYALGQPNGPGCDPICCGASDTLTVSAGP